MDAVRDLGQVEPWQASLERSLARRNSQSRSSVERDQARARRRRPSTRGRRATRARIRVRRAVALFVLALAITITGTLASGGTERQQNAAQALAATASALSHHLGSGGAGPLSEWPLSRSIEAGVTRACHPTSRPGDYVNPLAGAHVTPERIDQGVDYAGSGTITAIGGATVSYVASTGTGWPGSFVEYRLLAGPDVGCYVYYAEGVNPVAGLRVGQKVAAGQPIVRIIPGWSTGIELGWGAGVSTATYAAETHEWSATSDQDSVASTAGKSFSALIASLGGPPGKVEG